MKGRLRNATIDDGKILYDWFCDKDARANSLSNEIVTYEKHIKWLEKKLLSKDCLIYIYCIEEIPIGQIRIDINNEIGLISYSIAKDSRGNGYGENILILLENEIKDKNIKVLHGRVKFENAPSIKLFKKLNYIILEKNDSYLFEKEV